MDQGFSPPKVLLLGNRDTLPPLSSCQGNNAKMKTQGQVCEKGGKVFLTWSVEGVIEISFDKRLGRGGERDLPPSEISFPAREQSVLISKVDLYLDQVKEIRDSNTSRVEWEESWRLPRGSGGMWVMYRFLWHYVASGHSAYKIEMYWLVLKWRMKIILSGFVSYLREISLVAVLGIHCRKVLIWKWLPRFSVDRSLRQEDEDLASKSIKSTYVSFASSTKQNC